MIDSALNPQSPFLEDGQEPIEIVIGEGEPALTVELTQEHEPAFDANLVEHIDDSVIATLASDLLSDIDNDINSRRDWERTYVDGLDLLGLKLEERSEPWEGACGVYHPLLAEAVVRFQSEMIAETFPAQGPVKAKIVGKDDLETQEAAKRVTEDMNYQLTEKMTEFRPEHERMLWGLALAGSAFKKTYFDPSLMRQVSMYVPAEDIIVPYGASDLQSAPRITHRMRKTKNEVKKLQYAGFYRDIDLGEPSKDIDDIQNRKDEADGFSATYDNRFKIYEIHTELDIEGFEDIDPETGEPTGIALPYVVTIEKGKSEILAVRRNWDENDPLKLPKQHFVHYIYIPGFGFYGYGLIHLVGGFAKSATSIVRQLVDAGTLSNLPGGLKTRGLRIKGDDTPISPGEWRDVDVASGVLRDNLMPLPYKEPSATLYQLLQNVVEEGRRMAAVADVKFDGMNGEAPVGTTLAILERTLKVISAVQARCHAAMAQEFKLIAQLVRDYTAPEYEYIPEKGPPQAKKADYDRVEVIPVSDPNAATMAQRIIQYQAAIQLAQQSPQIYNLPQLHRQMLEVMGIKDADKIIPVEDDATPVDPVTENMAIIAGKPVKVFLEQDHEAHIQVHMSFKQDPKIGQMIGQNPQAQALTAAMDAHLMEHVGFAYRREIEKQLGVALPSPDEKMPPEMEAQLSQVVAQAAARLLQKDQAEAQAQQAAQQAQDPVVQMQQMELQLRQQELEIKKKAEEDKIVIEREKIDAQREIAKLNNNTKLEIDDKKIHKEAFDKGFDAIVKSAENQASRDHTSTEADKNRLANLNKQTSKE